MLFALVLALPVAPPQLTPTAASLVDSAVSQIKSQSVVFTTPTGTYGVWQYGPAPGGLVGDAAGTVASTALCGEALLRAPGWNQDPDRKGYVADATRLLMDTPIEDIETGYDFREALAYSFGLRYLRAFNSIGGPLGLHSSAGTTSAQVDARIEEYIDVLEAGLLPGSAPGSGLGYPLDKPTGWTYRRSSGDFESAFVTAPVLISLFEASADGYSVCPSAIQAGLDYLEGSRTSAGTFHYLDTGSVSPCVLPPPISDPLALEDCRASIIGASARRPQCELALYLWGRISQGRLAVGVEDFFSYYDFILLDFWDLTAIGHNPANYMIGDQYNLYSHYQTAYAVEQLPIALRDDRREFIEKGLEKMHDHTGGLFIDFGSSGVAGEAMAALALLVEQTSLTPMTAPPLPDFIRGDVDGDGLSLVNDAILISQYLAGDYHLCRQDAADVNDDGVIDFADVTHLLNGDPVPAPTAPGQDPTPDGLY